MFLRKVLEEKKTLCYDNLKAVKNMKVDQNPALCEEANKLNLSFFHFVHANLDSNWKGGTETILCSQLYYIRRGSATVICNDDTHLTMKAGNWYLLPTGTSVKYWCNDFMEEFAFHFKLCNIDHSDLLFRAPGPYCLPIAEDITDRLFKLLESSSQASAIELRGILFSELCRFITEFDIDLNRQKLSPCVSKSISYINRNLSMKISVEELAKHAYVSKSTLGKYFRRELAVSVNEYISDAVMLKASQLLRNSKMSVHDISEALGFCDQFYFSKCFKDKFKKSPKEFRNSPNI